MSAPLASVAHVQPKARAHGTEALVVGAALAVAAALGFSDLAGAGYWHDEIFTVDLVRLPLGRMLHEIPQTEGTPPVYYALAWCWTRAFGTSETGLRSFSALAGTLTVLPLYAAGRMLFSPRAGAAVAALGATSPLLLWYAQDARSYELGILAVVTSLAAVAAANRHGLSTRFVALWTAASLLALGTHYFTVFAIVPEAVWLLRLSRGPARRLVIAGVALVAGEGAALVPLVLAQRGNPTWIAARGLLARLEQVPATFLAGPQPSVALVGVPMLVLSIASLASLLRRNSGSGRTIVITLAVGATVVLAPLALVAVGTDYFDAQNVVFAWPFFLVAVAAGVTSSRLGLAAGAALVSLNVFVVAATWGQSKYGNEDWRAATALLGRPDGGRAIVMSPIEGENVLLYYRPRARPVTSAAIRIDEVDVVGLPTDAHRIGHNPLPPRPAAAPRLPGFRVVSSELGTDYTVFRLRSHRPITVKVGRLRALSLDGPPGLLVEH